MAYSQQGLACDNASIKGPARATLLPAIQAPSACLPLVGWIKMS